MFEHAKLKIKRANKHILELEREMDAFRQTDFYRFFVEKNPETGRSTLVGEVVQAVPEPVPLILGDAIHNLRSALDLGACEIYTHDGGSPKELNKVKFPVVDRRT